MSTFYAYAYLNNKNGWQKTEFAPHDSESSRPDATLLAIQLRKREHDLSASSVRTYAQVRFRDENIDEIKDALVRFALPENLAPYRGLTKGNILATPVGKDMPF
ncbi:MAG TPA: hypothetical protein V6C81_32440 [Planktothrix sp.]|jgi:hypothetical protein